MNKKYFLTRQTANLMEDFVREVSRGSALFLLYGDSGVGKTSLLKQLVNQRLANLTCHWIDFSESNDAETLVSITELAQTGDVIVVDHYDAASNRAQHQIFKTWSTEGRDKKLNIIISTTSGSFNVFRQLAQQYHVEAQSFQLMPCRAAEVESYLRFALFPDVSFGQLEISPTVRKQIRNARGVIAKLNEIIDREGDAIGFVTDEHKSPIVKVGLIPGMLLLMLIAAGLGYYFYQPFLPTPVNQELPVALPAHEPDEVPLEPEKPEVAEVAEVVEVEEVAEVEEVVEVAEVEEVVEVVEVVEEPEQSRVVEVDWFREILAKSTQWIHQAQPESGTIQIMALGVIGFNQEVFRGYLDRLKSKNVDINKIRVFKTRAGSQLVYSVIYGEYQSRQEASRQISALPEVLGADSPVSRTTGSIVSEIKRLKEN